MYGQLFCAFLAVSTSALCITSTFWSLWAMSSPESSSVLGTIWAWKGLWASCTQIEGGQYNCYEHNSLLMEDPYMNALRAMMCIGMCLSTASCFMILFGMECSQILGENLGVKQKLMRISGVLFCITGILTLASSAWYTSVIINEFFSFQGQDNLIKYEMGSTLFLAYIASFLCFITSLLCFCMPGPGPEKYEYGKPRYSLSAGDSYSKRGHDKTKDSSKMEYI